jgi:pantoate ligase / CMP/dCMP kinase
MIYLSPSGIRTYLEPLRREKTIALVPTMGALHRGHLSLIERARRENDIVVVSIFVNPLQFGANEDLDRYPRQIEKDRELCMAAGVDAIFLPSPETIGTKNIKTSIVVDSSLTDLLCGRSRPGHFTGMATIVTKLLNIVAPNRAYFGEKDAQQLAIVKQLVRDLNLDVKIVACPTVREENGLAMSSRNEYLTAEQRENAATIYRSLSAVKEEFATGNNEVKSLVYLLENNLKTIPEATIDYAAIVSADSLQPIERIAGEALVAVALKVGNTRLIDNIRLSMKKVTIAIDGPAGAGKSTVTRLVADSLGLLFLDTGAMYRAIAWLVLQAQVELTDAAAIADLVGSATIALTPDRVMINGEDVTAAIRTRSVTDAVSRVAAIGAVREVLVRQQQEIGLFGGIVAEGRDMCTQVFPAAEVKIFLTATPAERARRRQQDLISRGEDPGDLGELERSISERDRLDATRAISPLVKAADATEIVSDGLSIEAVVAKIVELYQQKLP